MNSSATIPTPATPSSGGGPDGLRPTIAKIGWVVYVGSFLSGALFSPAFNSSIPALVASIVMTVASVSVARASRGLSCAGGIVALLFASGLVALLANELASERKDEKTLLARVTARGLIEAANQYRIEYGSFPTGSPVEIAAALLGDNPRKIVFFEPRPGERSASGELLDPWGTPYHFDLSDPTNPKIYSFGKNKRDDHGADGSDDICSWKWPS